MENKKCPVCKKIIIGRTDKKFCSQECKNAYHSRLKKYINASTSQVDKILHRNYAILVELLKRKNYLETTKNQLENKGFVFHYCTSTYINTQNKQCYYVYDYLWFELSNKKVYIKKLPDTIKKNIS